MIRSFKAQAGFYLMVAGLLCAFSSCFVNNRLAYLQGLKDSTYIPTHYQSPVLIQSGDLLSINISTSDPGSANIFNAVNAAGQVAGGEVANPGIQVNASGTVDLPKIGSMLAAGKTTEALSKDIKAALQPYYKDLVVHVRMINFRVTMIGEVGRPASLTIPTERITIFEAIGMAGDLKETASRKDVMVVRDSAGAMQTGHIDLSHPSVIHSPYYFLKPGDMVYVHPIKARSITSSGALTLWPIVLSTLTASLLLIRTFSN